MPIDVPFLDLGSDDLVDQDSDLNYGSTSRAPKSTDTDKTLAVLNFMKQSFPRFSLRDFITELFTSDNGSIKNVANKYLSMCGHMHLLDTVIGDKCMQDDNVADWVMEQATAICS